MLFNLDRAMQTGGRNVIVVEGFFDALKVHQAGLATVIALMGSSFSQRQSDLLLSHFANVTLMLDGDDTGRWAADVIVPLLQPKASVRNLKLPNRVQPDQLSSAEINVLVGPANYTSRPSSSTPQWDTPHAYTTRYPIPTAHQPNWN